MSLQQIEPNCEWNPLKSWISFILPSHHSSLLALGILFPLVCFAALPPESTPPSADRPIVKPLGNSVYQLGAILLNTETKRLSFPAQVNQTNQVLEYALVSDYGKTHESLLSTSVSPKELQVALLLMGLKASETLGDTNRPIRTRRNAWLRIYVDGESSGVQFSNRLESWIGIGTKDSDKLLSGLMNSNWVYTGSIIDHGKFVAQEEGSIVTLIRDPAAMISNPAPDREDDDIHYVNASVVPPKKTPVRVTFEIQQ